MAKKRTYSDQEKAEALAHLDSVGGNLTLAANQLGIPRGTLRRWNDEEQHVDIADLRHKKRGELRDLLTEWVFKMLKVVVKDENIEDASYRDLITGIGVAVDKIAKLSEANEGVTTGIDLMLEEFGDVDETTW